MSTCAHGLAGPCPDCPPDCHTVGEVRGARAAIVRGREVLRIREDGSYDWATVHMTKGGARRAAAEYERTGRVVGARP